MFEFPILFPIFILSFVCLAILLAFLLTTIMEKGKMSSPLKRIKFYGSQIGSQATIPKPYTDSPLTLLRSDILSALRFYLFLPFIVMPITPQLSGPLSELYPSLPNIWSMVLHLILFCMQAPFLLSIPCWVFFPVWSVLIGVGIFWAVNQGFCYLLNGNKMEIRSEAKYTEKREAKDNEQWLFLNGVAVGYISPRQPFQLETN
jgi:hypothetical protein